MFLKAEQTLSSTNELAQIATVHVYAMICTILLSPHNNDFDFESMPLICWKWLFASPIDRLFHYEQGLVITSVVLNEAKTAEAIR